MINRQQASQSRIEARAERLAALNLMEDALAARREAEEINNALRASEARLATELADMQLLHEVSSSLIKDDDINALYRQILEAACALVHSEMASLQRLVPERQELFLLAEKGLQPASAKFWEWVTADDTTSCGVVLAKGEPVIVPDVELWDLVEGTDNLQHYRRCRIRAMLSMPLIARGGKLVGVMSTHWQEVHQPSPRDFRLLDLLARQAADLLERHTAAEALRDSEKQYRSLFESIDEGFCTIELIFEDGERAVDFRFLQVSPSFARQTGIEGAIGRRMRELVPHHEEFWFETYGRVAKTGEPVRFEKEAKELGRIYDVYAFRVGDSQLRRVGTLFNDITERKRAEEALSASQDWQAFLLKLSDALRPLADAEAIKAAAAQLLAVHLGVNRAFYADAENSHWRVTKGYEDGVHPLPDVPFPMADYGAWIIDQFQAGQRLVVPDLATDLRFQPAERIAHAALQIGAEVAVPLVKEGRLTAMLVVQSAAPRNWSERAIALVEETAERTWAAVERARAEVALRASEDQMRTIADAVPQIIWTNSREGSANFFNRRWYEYSGLTVEESVGPGWQGIVHPDDAQRSVPAWQKAVASGEVFDIEYRLRRADGAYRWFIGRNVPMRDASGNVVAWFGTATDVDDLKKAELAVRANEEQFRRAIEDAPIPVIMHAEDGQVLQISHTWTELTGFTQADIPTFDAWLTRAYGAGAEKVRSHMEQLFAGDVRQLDIEIEVLTRSGATRIWSFSASAPGKLWDGRRYVVGMALDVTERRQVEDALRDSQERLRLIVESAREYAIFSMDLERRVTSWNPGAERLLGYAEVEILGQLSDVIFTAEDRAQRTPEDEASRAVNEGRASDERWHVRKDQSVFWGSGVMMPMRDREKRTVGLLKIFRDQTEELRAKEALVRHHEELWDAFQETERARAAAEAAGHAKDHFLAVLSHELRTPLTPVLLAVQLLNRDKSLSPQGREALTMIERNVKLEANFIDDLLDVTRISRGKLELVLEPLDLHEVLRQAAEIAGVDLAAKQQTLKIALQAVEHRFKGDAKRLQQVFWNLLKNASKFTPAKGEIILSTRNEAERILIEVRDTGIGFKPDVAIRIFNAFEQASQAITREFGGLGLGLAISKASVEAHGGTISAESEGEGRGAIFTVGLPLG